MLKQSSLSEAAINVRTAAAELRVKRAKRFIVNIRDQITHYGLEKVSGTL